MIFEDMATRICEELGITPGPGNLRALILLLRSFLADCQHWGVDLSPKLADPFQEPRPACLNHHWSEPPRVVIRVEHPDTSGISIKWGTRCGILRLSPLVHGWRMGEVVGGER